MIIANQFSFHGTAEGATRNANIDAGSISFSNSGTDPDRSFQELLREPRSPKALTDCAPVNYSNLTVEQEVSTIRDMPIDDEAKNSSAFDLVSTMHLVGSERQGMDMQPILEASIISSAMHPSRHSGTFTHPSYAAQNHTLMPLSASQNTERSQAATSERRIALTVRVNGGQSWPVTVNVLPGPIAKVVIRSQLEVPSHTEQEILDHVRGLLLRHGLERAQIIVNGKPMGRGNAD